MRTTVLVATVLLLGATATPGVAQPEELSPIALAYTPVSDAELVDPPDSDWLMWRRSYGHWGHSPLTQINTSNVGTLRLAWAWTMAEGLQETTPLVHDGMMFLVQACDYVEALDLRDGTRIWEYRRERVEHPANLACANRSGALGCAWDAAVPGYPRVWWPPPVPPSCVDYLKTNPAVPAEGREVNAAFRFHQKK